MLPPGYAQQFMARQDVRAIGTRRARNVKNRAQILANQEVGHHNSKPIDYHGGFVVQGPEQDGDQLLWIIGNNAEHATFVEKGVRRHEISVRRPGKRSTGAKALNFWWERAGVQFNGPKVNHPGTQESRPNGYRILERALREGNA